MGLHQRIFHASLRLCASLGILVWLGGCFASETELVGYWAADRPMLVGVYAHTPTRPDGSEWQAPTWTGQVALERRRYVSHVENFPHQGARFLNLHGDIYIAQIPRQDGVGYGIAFVYDGGRTVTYHQPGCADVSPDTLEQASLQLDPEGFCLIEDVDRLQAVMRAYLDDLDGDVRIDGVYRFID